MYSARMYRHSYSSIILVHTERKSVPLLSYMILLEIPSVEEGTSKEKEGWRMAVVAAAVVAIVEAAVQILSVCTFVQGRKAAQLVMGSLSGMHKGRDCECYTPSKN